MEIYWFCVLNRIKRTQVKMAMELRNNIRLYLLDDIGEDIIKEYSKVFPAGSELSSISLVGTLDDML